MTSLAATCELIERTLGQSPAFRKVEERLYVVHQGSAYVTLFVHSSRMGVGDEPAVGKPVVQVYAQVASGVRPEPSLFRQLLVLNGRLRFGAFAYVPEGDVVLFVHSILGGEHMDAKELLAIVTDVALVADAYDDRIVARYGGERMQDLVEHAALQHLLGETDEDLLLPAEAPAHPTNGVHGTRPN